MTHDEHDGLGTTVWTSWTKAGVTSRFRVPYDSLLAGSPLKVIELTPLAHSLPLLTLYRRSRLYPSSLLWSSLSHPGLLFPTHGTSPSTFFPYTRQEVSFLGMKSWCFSVTWTPFGGNALLTLLAVLLLPTALCIYKSGLVCSWSSACLPQETEPGSLCQNNVCCLKLLAKNLPELFRGKILYKSNKEWIHKW